MYLMIDMYLRNVRDRI